MDLPATQVFDEDDLPTQKYSQACQDDELKEVAVLIINSIPHGISKGINKIGRHPACNIIIDDQTVSKKHAEIEAGGKGKPSWICDLNSSNKTKLNNAPLRPNRNYELKHDSVIEFGKVRAVFKVHDDMDVDKDKSMVPATPGLTERKPASRQVIPSTPDSSLNNSSALEEDLSSIPGTQADELDPVFRRPSLPRRRNSEEQSRRSLLHDSSLDNSADNSRVCTIVQKSTGGDRSGDINIHDMETQKLDLSSSVDDIYDMETQRICTNIDGKDGRNSVSNPCQSKDIHDVETQDISNAIHDMETQKQVDVFNAETQNASNNIHEAETQETENDMHNMATQKLDVVSMRQGASNGANKSNNTLDTKGVSQGGENVATAGQSNENNEYDNDFVKLTLTPNFEEDVNQLDVSSCQGSPNLIEGFFDNVDSPLNEAESHSKESSKDSKSLEEENIFEAPTQQMKKSPSSQGNDSIKTNSTSRKDIMYILDSESDTDDEAIHIKETEVSEKSTKPSKIQKQDSDSETDEEGQFSEFARNRNEKNSTSLSRKEDNNEQNKSDPSTSVESDDIFEMPTQRIVTDEDSKSEKVASNKQIDRESSPQKIADNRDDVVDSMAPTQLLNDIDDSTSKSKVNNSNIVSDVNSEREKNTLDVDDMAPTQIINTDSQKNSTCLENQLPLDQKKDSKREAGTNKTSMLSTRDSSEQQSTFIDETSSESSFDERGRTPALLGSIEDISYEMATTQVLDEKEEAPTKAALPQKSVSKVTLRNHSKRVKGQRSMLDDTLERNLNNMFEGDTRDSDTGRPSLMSTQCLEDVLQMSQDDRELLDIAVASGKISAVKDAKVVLIRGLEPSGNSTPIPKRNTSTPTNSITGNVPKKASKRGHDVPKRASIPKAPSKTTGTRRQSRKVNLNDTIEKNLINMFDDVNEDMEEPPHISTQCLEDVLQMSQVNAEPNNELSDNSSTSAVQETKNAIRSKTTKRTSLSNKSSTRATRSGLKDEMHFNESNVDSPSSDTYFAKLTTRRKRNVLRDSQDSIDQSKSASNQPEKATAKAQVVVTKINTAVLGKRGKESSQKESSLKTKNDTATLKKANDSDDEFMASLPLAKISGTVSNPPSPSTSSTSTVQNDRAKRKGKKKMPSIKEYLSGDLNPTTSPKTRIDVGKIMASENDEEYKKLKIIADRLLSVKPKYIDKGSVFSMDDCDDDVAVATDIHQSSNIETKEIGAATSSRRKSTGNQSNSGKRSPILSSSKRARQSSKKDDEHSRVFQVENPKPAAKVTAESGGRKGKSKESTKENNVRGRKRSLSTAEKPKEDTTQKRLKLLETKEEKATVETARTRRSASKMDRKSESESILNFLTKNPPSRITRNRPSIESVNMPQPSLTSRMSETAKVQLESMNNTENMRTEVNEPLVPRLNIKRIKLQSGETQFSTRSSAAASTDESGIPTTELEVKTTNVKGRKRKAKAPNVTVTSESGAESQEIEMIMQNSSSDVSTTSLGNKKRPTTSIKNASQNSKKRVNSKSDDEPVPAHSNPLDNHAFEAPTAKPKRGRAAKQKNQSSTSITEEQSQRSARSLRSSQISIVNSSTGESTDGESQDSGAEKKSRPNRSRAAPKVKKTEQSDTDTSSRSKTDTEKSMSSSVNSSTDSVALNSSPFRVRRSMSSMSTGSPSRTKQRVLFTGITDTEYGNILKKLGGVAVEEPTNCDVLVTDKVRRTVKFLCALARSIPIVSVAWLTESKSAGHLLEWENFILKDPAAEAKFGFKLRKSLERAKQHKLLDGYTILLTPKVAPPPIAEFKAMITSCGGKVIVRAPAKWQANTVIVSREEDSSNAKKFLSKAPSTVTVQSTEFILTGILRQELDFDKNKLL